MGFLNDLKRGEEGEDFVIKKLQELYGGVAVKSGGAKGWDFSLSNRGWMIRCECKSDFMSAKTGRIFFETHCNNKESGLSSTTADRWTYLLPDNCIYIFEPQKMLEWLKVNGKPVGGGDGGRAKGFLVKTSVVDQLDFVKKIEL
jgi:hypothetical protein